MANVKKLDIKINLSFIVIMTFEETLKKIIEENFLIQKNDTPFLNEQTVQFKIAIELYKELGIEVELEKCFNPFKEKKDYLDIFYAKDKIGIELKYKLKRFKNFPFSNQSAQDLGSYGFFIDINRLENWVMSNHLTTGYAIIITNDEIYTKERSGNTKDFSLTSQNSIVSNREYITHKGKTMLPITFKKCYPSFSWITHTPNTSEECQFWACIMKVS